MSSQFYTLVAKDLVKVSKVDETQFANAIGALHDEAAFLGSSRTLEIISEHVIESSSAETIKNLVFALHDWVNEQGAALSSLNKSFKKALQDSDTETSDFEDTRFDECLKALAGPFAGIKRQANATRVAAISGSRLKGVTFVSDLRPVYSQPDRDSIDGFIPMTTMIINSEDVSGQDQQLDLIVSLSELESIIAEANKAKNKINQLVEFSATAGIPVPSLGLNEKQDNSK